MINDIPDWCCVGFPRKYGNPIQVPVNSKEEILSKINQSEAENKDSYLSISYFPDENKVGITEIFLDFDTHFPQEIGMIMLLLKKKLQTAIFQKTLSWRLIYSGKKGFHLRILLKPAVYELTDDLKQTYKMVQLFFSKGLEKYTDIHVLGDVKRIARIPGTTHSGSKKTCYVLKAMDNPETLMNLQEIYQFCIDNNMMLDDLVESEKIEGGASFFADIDYLSLPNEHFIVLLPSLIPQKCVWHHLTTEKNPLHFVRVASCIMLKYLGVNLKSAQAFYTKCGMVFNWEDVDNVSRRTYQVESLYLKNYYPMGCQKLYEYLPCFYDCPFYKDNIMKPKEILEIENKKKKKKWRTIK